MKAAIISCFLYAALAAALDAAVVFLASDESAFTVGAEVMIDGGAGNL